MSAFLFHGTEMSSARSGHPTELRFAAHIGLLVADARQARRWLLRELADRAGISVTRLHDVEHGRPASLATYAAIARALQLELRIDIVDPRKRVSVVRSEDPVHAAMGEMIAARLMAFGHTVAIDEPYQHFQFAGRADVLAWDAQARHLLHVENRTRFPNVQEASGSYNAKRRYLPGVIAERLGRHEGFASVTHVMAGLWSAELIHAVRMRPATFAAVCPDDPTAFTAWWSGTAPPAGVSSTFVMLDPVPATARHRSISRLDLSTRPRYRGYADAAAALSRGGVYRS